jgi:hypothetical protein
MADTERVWLVSRTYTDRDLVVLEYATPDGERYLRRELAAQATGADVTAARDVDPERLHPVGDEATRERYREEAERMAARHDPDETV